VHHEVTAHWLSSCLNGHQRIGFPWQTFGTFLRIATHRRIASRPLRAGSAQDCVDAWLDVAVAWVPPTTVRTARVYGELARRHHTTGNLVPDAQLAALALEHGVAVASADSAFARFPEVTWLNPLVSTS
jgi:uncharacterized protein